MKRIKIIYLIAALILILSLTLVTGCYVVVEPGTPPSAPPGTSPPATRNATSIDPKWEIPAESQSPILPSVADVVAKVKPSVVAINTITYDRFNQPRPGAGSGWILREDGIIVTNNHVVAGSINITVILDDGRIFPAAVNTVATDWLTDLAVFKIDAENLPAATVGDSSKLRIGDWVVAIGNSLGQGISATTGIVSALGVSLDVSPTQTLYGLVQTDAAINPGNSGGPLVNMAGEVIGINSIKRTQLEVEGVGWAISANEAMPTIKQLITTGYVVRPFLGVQGLLTVDQAVTAFFNLSVEEGVLVRGVSPGSPADKAGLKADDVITKFAGQDVSNVKELIQAIHSAQLGQQVEIIFWRGETENTAYATLAESPPPS